MNKPNITKLTITIGDNTFQWETPYSDTSVDDVLTAVYGMLVGHTFLPETILTSMIAFAEERLPKETEES